MLLFRLHNGIKWIRTHWVNCKRKILYHIECIWVTIINMLLPSKDRRYDGQILANAC